MRGRNPIDISGVRFGRLIALEDIGQARNGRGRLWLCLCDCGEFTNVPACYLRSGNTTSCGCAQREAAAMSCVSLATHGLTGHRISTIHRSMILRCDDPSSVSYQYYGAVGIKVCHDWYDLRNFADWAFANGYDAHLTIDRIDNDDGYSPENCRWATYKDQANNRTGNFVVNFNGDSRTVAQWSDETGIGVSTILYRLHAGWDVATALTRERNHGMRYLG